MKKYFSLVFFLSFSIVTVGQNSFQQLIGGPDKDRAQTVFYFSLNYFVSGASYSFGAGDVDAILIRFDDQGFLVWAKAYGTIAYDNSEFALESSDHSIVCSGRSNIVPGQPTSAILFKVDPDNGTLMWTKKFGGTGNDDIVNVIQTSDNGFACVGFTESLSSGSSDILLIKTDINGDTIFTRAFGTVEDEDGTSIIQLPDNGYLISGRQITYPNGKQESDGILLRTDASGNLLWAKQYGDSLWEELTSVKLLSDGGFIVTGSTSTFGAGNYDILIMKTDTGGAVTWSRTFGKDWTDAGYDIHVNPNQSLVVSGYTESLGFGHVKLGGDSANIFLLKTDANGNFIWMQTYGDGKQDEAFRSSKMFAGGFAIPGFTNNYHLNDSAQMIIIMTDSNGVSGCHEQSVIPIDSTVSMPFYSVNYTQLSGISFSTISLTETIINPQIEDACLYTNTNQLTSAFNTNVYPNPFNESLMIETSINENLTIDLFDLLSRKIYSSDFNSIISINTSQLSKGIYFYQLKNKNEMISQGKIIKN